MNDLLVIGSIIDNKSKIEDKLLEMHGAKGIQIIICCSLFTVFYLN